jgi:hypothetical protein
MLKISQGKEGKDGGKEAIFEDIVVKNFPKLRKISSHKFKICHRAKTG